MRDGGFDDALHEVFAVICGQTGEQSKKLEKLEKQLSGTFAIIDKASREGIPASESLVLDVVESTVARFWPVESDAVEPKYIAQ